MTALDDLSEWCRRLEGRHQSVQDAAHWVDVYTSLLSTLEAVAMEVPDVRPRVHDLRRRLLHWQQLRAASLPGTAESGQSG